MRTRTLTALAIGCLFLGAASVFADDKDKKEKKDLDALQGTWKFESFRLDGQDSPEEFVKEMRFVIKDNNYTFIVNGQEVETGTIKLDPEKKTKTIDLDIKSGNDEGKKQPGIYTLKGDTFTFCLAHPGGNDRPTKLESTDENKTVLGVLKRETK
jgi:uncharacterized protein (TIGR03067 family)